MNYSPSPGSSQSSTKQNDVKKKKKSWSLEGKKKKGQPKSRQQIKAMLLAKEKIREEDLDAPPNSDAKDDSLRIDEQQRYMPEKEEYVRKQPQIGIKRKVKKKGSRRALTVREVRRKSSRTGTSTPKLSREESGHPIDTSLFKERASANNSNANSPDNSDRLREREARRRAAARDREDRTQRDLSRERDHSGTPMDSDGDSTPLPLAREPEPEIRRSAVVQQQPQSSSGSSRMTEVKNKEHSLMLGPTQQLPVKESVATARPQQTRNSRSTMGLPTPFVAAKSSGEMTSSTQLALEPEPDLDRVRRQKEAAFMKRFLTALKLLPNTAPPRAATPAPRSEDSDSSKRHARGNVKHNMHHNMRKQPK